MNGMIVVAVAAVVLAAGYLLYGRWLARTWGVDREALTPAKRMEDGKNFSPASCFTAFSHQFSSICGAGPVTGTIAAMMFGWLPVLLWVLVGGIFFGAVHDFGALYASVKNNGKSLAQLVEKYIGRTGRRLFLLFSWLFTIIVIAAFVDMVAGTFMATFDASGAVDTAASYSGGAAGTISILFTFVAIAFGWINRRFGLSGWKEFVLAVALFVAMFAVGMQFPVYLDKYGWFAVIMVYLLFAAAMPIQTLKQPRDYLTSIMMIVMIVCAVLGIFVLGAMFPWESIFLINVPIGAASFLIGLKTLPRETGMAGERAAAGGQVAGERATATAGPSPANVPDAGARFDIPGALLMAPAIFLVFFAINAAGSGSLALAGALLAGGLVLLAAFVRVERRAQTPLVRIELLRNPVFSLNLVAMFCCYLAVGATEFILPFYLQDACGYASDVAGLVITAIPVAMALASPVAGALSDRIGTTIPCFAGLVVYSAGIALAGMLPAGAPILRIYPTLMFMALGDGLFESPNNSRIMGSVDQKDLGFAGSLGTLVRYMGMSAGVTGGTALLYGHMSEVAGFPVSGFMPEWPELFMEGFSFAFLAIAATVAAGAVLTVVGTVIKRRQRMRREARA